MRETNHWLRAASIMQPAKFSDQGSNHISSPTLFWPCQKGRSLSFEYLAAKHCVAEIDTIKIPRRESTQRHSWNAMRNPNSISPLFLSIALSTSASVIPLPPSIHVTDPGLAAGNISLNTDGPDPRFSITHRFDTPLLPIDPCLMSVLYFMSEIAYGDFTQRHPPKTYRVPGYDEVEIVTNTAMAARFLIWGIWLAMEYMMNNNIFRNVLFTLRWEETILGTINIQASAPRLSLPGSSNIQRLGVPSTGNGTATPRADVNDTSISNNSLDAQCEVFIHSYPDCKTLTKYEVFMACYSGLLYCAWKPTTAPMRDFGYISPIGDVSLYLFQYGPSLAYAYITRSLSHIPRYLLEDPLGFREISFDVKLDEVLCARGAITKGRA